MDPYLALRHQAAAKRDDAIAAARRIYRADIEAIENLQRSIPAEIPLEADYKRGPNTIELMRTLLPADKPFTVTDVLHWMHDATNGQQFNEGTIRSYLWKLSRRGIVRKLYKTGQNEHMWAATESNVTAGSIETMSLPQVVELILSEEGRPLKTIELAVAMQSRGYRQRVMPQSLMRAIRDMFKRYPGRFVADDKGRWAAVG